MWSNPLELKLLSTDDSDSFKTMPCGHTGLPVGNHCGAFGVQRKHHVHEGVDLYCPEYSKVFAVEAGEVVAVLPFTGPAANLPWWEDTQVVLVEGESGVVAYGEIISCVEVGKILTPGDRIGSVKRVLRNFKGRPMSMLHLELHTPGTRFCPAWDFVDQRPVTLLDPTPHLIPVCAGTHGC